MQSCLQFQLEGNIQFQALTSYFRSVRRNIIWKLPPSQKRDGSSREVRVHTSTVIRNRTQKVNVELYTPFMFLLDRTLIQIWIGFWITLGERTNERTNERTPHRAWHLRILAAGGPISRVQRKTFVHSLFFRNVVVFKADVCCEILPRPESPLTGKALVNCTSFVHSLCFRNVAVFRTAFPFFLFFVFFPNQPRKQWHGQTSHGPATE